MYRWSNPLEPGLPGASGRAAHPGPVAVPARPLVQVENVTHVYRVGRIDVHAVRGVSLTIPAGEFVTLLGPSGCGKSTLLHIIGGILRPTSGRVIIDGNDYSVLSESQRTALRGREIGIVFQKIHLLPTLDANANIDIARDIAGIHSRDHEWHRELVERLGLAKRLWHRPAELSGGEQQRVAIARALINRPKILLADEPTGNLDSVNSANVLTILAELNRDLGQTILMITHNPEAAAYANRVLHMKDGRLVTASPP